MMIHNILSHIFMNDDILWWQIINAKRVGLIELFYHCSLLPFSHGTLFGKVEKHYKIKEITGVYECKILKTMNMHTLYIHNISIVSAKTMHVFFMHLFHKWTENSTYTVYKMCKCTLTVRSIYRMPAIPGFAPK